LNKVEDREMEHSKHIARMAILVILILVGFHIFRTLFTPKSFGRYGHYRADNVTEQMAKPVVHGENHSCSQCHEEILKEIGHGSHKSLSCESCHAPVSLHVREGELIGKMPKNISTALCLRCHEKLESRPKTFPQIVSEDHIRRAQMEMAPDVCLRCHKAHVPGKGL
jgi:ribosomal protein L37AE/L43A